MGRIDRIRGALSGGLNPSELVITDETHQHAGHGVEGEETHLHLRVVSDQFQGKTKIERSRMVYALLQGELASGLHALRLELLTGQEAHLFFQSNK